MTNILYKKTENQFVKIFKYFDLRENCCTAKRLQLWNKMNFMFLKGKDSFWYYNHGHEILFYSFYKLILALNIIMILEDKI